MDAATSIQMGRLENPQIVRVEVALWHGVLSVVLPLKVKYFELGAVLAFLNFVLVVN